MEISEFDPDEQLFRRCNTLFVGGSSAARRVCRFLSGRATSVVVFTEHDDPEHPWTDDAPSAAVYPRFEPKSVEAAFDKHDEAMETALENDKNGPIPELLLVLEGIDSDGHDPFQDNIYLRLMINGRCRGITVMTLLRNADCLSREARGMIDTVFVQEDVDAPTRKKLHEVFGGVVEYPEFEALFEECTKDHGALVIFTRATSYDPTDTFFRLRPEIAKSV